MSKQKVSLTIDEDLLRNAARLARGRTRSEVIEAALAEWVHARKRQKLDEEVERYYRSLGDEEREEDAAWARLGDDTLRRSR